MKNEHIIAVSNNAFKGITPNVLYKENFDFDPLGVIIAHRELLDNKPNEDGSKGEPSFRQVIGYVLVRQGNNFLGYRRKGTEERLNGKVSIGFGGHTTVADIGIIGDLINVTNSVRKACLRELNEELRTRKAPATGSPENEFKPFQYCECVNAEVANTPLILCDRTEVDRLHVGLVLELVVNNDLEFMLGDHGSELLWVPYDELVKPNHSSDLVFEEWSRIVLEAQ